MEFIQLHDGLDCDCIESAKQNCSDLFARKVDDTVSSIKYQAFKASATNRKAVEEDCYKSCSRRAISIDIWTEETLPFLEEKHRKAIELAQQFRNKLVIFKIRENGGYVKHTPVLEPENPYHHDLYLPDSFKDNPGACLEFITHKILLQDAV